MKKETIHIIFSLIIFISILYVAISPFSKTTEPVYAMAPFGGRVISYLPEAPGCAPITAAIAVATGGTAVVTIEQIIVGGLNGGTFGILRINGITVPLLTKIYPFYTYMIPGNMVLGNYFDLCGSGLLGGVASKIAKAACTGTGTICPINQLVHHIGSTLTPIPF